MAAKRMNKKRNRRRAKNQRQRERSRRQAKRQKGRTKRQGARQQRRAERQAARQSGRTARVQARKAAKAVKHKAKGDSGYWSPEAIQARGDIVGQVGGVVSDAAMAAAGAGLLGEGMDALGGFGDAFGDGLGELGDMFGGDDGYDDGGGRAGTAPIGGMPPWAIPAALGGILLIVFMTGKK